MFIVVHFCSGLQGLSSNPILGDIFNLFSTSVPVQKMYALELCFIIITEHNEPKYPWLHRLDCTQRTWQKTPPAIINKSSASKNGREFCKQTTIDQNQQFPFASLPFIVCTKLTTFHTWGVMNVVGHVKTSKVFKRSHNSFPFFYSRFFPM
jgi:hypothetical protein